MANKVRLGIIGLGAQGSMYAKFIADGMVPNMVIGAIGDLDPAKAEIAKSAYPGFRSTPTTSRCWRAVTWTRW